MQLNTALKMTLILEVHVLNESCMRILCVLAQLYVFKAVRFRTFSNYVIKGMWRHCAECIYAASPVKPFCGSHGRITQSAICGPDVR